MAGQGLVKGHPEAVSWGTAAGLGWTVRMIGFLLYLLFLYQAKSSFSACKMGFMHHEGQLSCTQFYFTPFLCVLPCINISCHSNAIGVQELKNSSYIIPIGFRKRFYNCGPEQMMMAILSNIFQNQFCTTAGFKCHLGSLVWWNRNWILWAKC